MHIFPKLLYNIDGKENAQIALDTLARIFFKHPEFERKKTSFIQPPYNEKITDMIYVAQGDRDEKLKSENKRYFDVDHGMIYYDPTISGIRQDYSLASPCGIMITNTNQTCITVIAEYDRDGEKITKTSVLGLDKNPFRYTESFMKLKTIKLIGDLPSRVVIENVLPFPIEVVSTSGNKYKVERSARLAVQWRNTREITIHIP